MPSLSLSRADVKRAEAIDRLDPFRTESQL
jgi:hypothetical protein